MLSDNEKDTLVRRMPKIELSYDRILHKKVYAELYMIIPKGPKAFMWLTYIEDKFVCLIIKLGHKGFVKDISIYKMCFDNELAIGDIGTFLYGTILTIDKKPYFSCENIYYYKNKYIGTTSLVAKIYCLKDMFSNHIKQTNFGKNFLIAGIPICKSTYSSAMDEVKSLPYSVYGIQHHNFASNRGALGISLVKEKFIPETNFLVKAAVEADIYELYCYDPERKNIPYGIAMISNYKTSVMMNSLFRNIKENRNLDLLEESDDEEEFENINEDKFVDLNKSFVMKCVYSHRFNKWQPIEVIQGKTRLATYKEATNLEKNNR
jgi:hypothetical protein